MSQTVQERIPRRIRLLRSLAMSQTKQLQEKAESKQVISSQKDTEALSNNSTIKYKFDHCVTPRRKDVSTNDAPTMDYSRMTSITRRNERN